MLYRHSRTSHELAWIFSARRQTRSDESGKKKRSASGGKRGKRLFGTVIPRQRLAHSTSIRQTSISTNRLLPSIARRDWGRKLSLWSYSGLWLRSSLQARFKRHWSRYRPRSGATASRCWTARSPYPSKACRCGSQRSLIHCCNGIIGPTASVNVPYTCATCYAPSAPLSGFRLGPTLWLSASTSSACARIKRTSRATARPRGHSSPR